jgi:hypothetical protein
LDHDAIAPHRKNLLRILPKDLTLEEIYHASRVVSHRHAPRCSG